jgi:hypothetical protein
MRRLYASLRFDDGLVVAIKEREAFSLSQNVDEGKRGNIA